MKIKCAIDAVGKTFGCVHLRQSTDGEVNESKTRGTGISEQGGPIVRE